MDKDKKKKLIIILLTAFVSLTVSVSACILGLPPEALSSIVDTGIHQTI